MAATSAQSSLTPRFLRRTSLQLHERNTNFTMLDNEIAAAVTSPEADAVTPLMSKIYLRLKTAPRHFFESDGVLRFAGEEREGKRVTAWEQLRQHLRVSSETANKALQWMHAEGIIGYSAFKNGVGIRIFLNRAASSIGFRPDSGEQKILRFPHTSVGNSPASVSEAAFKDKNSKNDLDKDIKSDAPKNGANTKSVDKKVPDPIPPPNTLPCPHPVHEGREVEATAQHSGTVSMDEIVTRLKNELEPCVRSAAAQAAAQTAAREIARTREWFETKALPKAVRVAQRETYNLLRKQGHVDERVRRARADLEVGRSESECAPPAAQPLAQEEIREAAETCIALLETQGKSIEVTLSEISSENGGWLLPEDAPRVREAAQALMKTRTEFFSATVSSDLT